MSYVRNLEFSIAENHGKLDLEVSKLQPPVSFQKKIYSNGLKLSVVVYSCSAEILIFSCVSMICDAAMAAANLMQVWPKINLFDIIIYVLCFLQYDLI